jgi:hypothetical protein
VSSTTLLVCARRRGIEYLDLLRRARARARAAAARRRRGGIVSRASQPPPARYLRCAMRCMGASILAA